MAYLVWTSRSGAAEVLYLRHRHSLGRRPDNDVQVLDPLVSVRHAVLERTDDRWWLRDLESRNGTWLNGQRVQGAVALRHLDEIRIGEARLTYTDMAEAMVHVTSARGASNGGADSAVARVVFHAQHQPAASSATRPAPRVTAASPDPAALGRSWPLLHALGRAVEAAHLDELAEAFLQDALDAIGSGHAAWYWLPCQGALEPAFFTSSAGVTPRAVTPDRDLVARALEAERPMNVVRPGAGYRAEPTTALVAPFVRFGIAQAWAWFEFDGGDARIPWDRFELLTRIVAALLSELRLRG